MSEVRLIDANELIIEMEAGCLPIDEKGISGILGDNSCVRDYINAAPTIEAEPVRHGHWVLIEHEFFTCSECGNAYFTGADSTSEAMHKLKTGDYFAYCPHCGAKMDRDTANKKDKR